MDSDQLADHLRDPVLRHLCEIALRQALANPAWDASYEQCLEAAASVGLMDDIRAARSFVERRDWLGPYGARDALLAALIGQVYRRTGLTEPSEVLEGPLRSVLQHRVEWPGEPNRR